MNANSGEAPRFELPAVPSGEGRLESGARQETAPTPESVAAKQPPRPIAHVQMPVVPVPQSMVPLASSAAPIKSTDDDLQAADVDRIEKEWVEKAKRIITRTKDDPHLQNSEMSRVKAEYIKKRYNKTIPTDDTVTV